MKNGKNQNEIDNDPNISESDLEQLRVYFFDFWRDDTPILKEFERDAYVMADQEVRQAILNVLARGVWDIYPPTKKARRRRALSVQEILSEVNKLLPDQIKKSNLYFHLDRLKEYGHIKIVGEIPFGTGGRTMAYYGRTARIFIMRDFDRSEFFQILNEEPFFELIQAFNPNVPIDKIEKTLDKVRGINNYNKVGFSKWIRKHDDILKANEVDFRDLYAIISILQRYNQKVAEGIKELSDLLKITQNE